jgi:two-component system nitrate/nitrite response regulator NarL
LLPILVLEPDKVCRFAVTSLLSGGGMHVSGQVATATEAVELLHTDRFGVLVTEISLPDMSLPTLLATARSMQPWLGVVGLTGEHDAGVLEHALGHGLRGLLSKYASPAQLVRRINTAASGGLVLDEVTVNVLRDVLAARRAPVEGMVLTEREREVLTLIRAGHTTRSAASYLSLAESTIKSHAAKAASRLGVRSSQAAAEQAQLLGLLDTSMTARRCSQLAVDDGILLGGGHAR